MLNPQLWWRRRAQQRLIDKQLPDMLMRMAVALKAGTAFSQVMSQVSVHSKGVLASEFERANQEIASGKPADEVLEAMAKRVGSADLTLAVLAINVHSRAGGNLSEALVSIANRIRERVKLRDEIRTLTTQTRASGWFLTVIPLALAVVLFFLTPDYFRPAFLSVGGAVVSVAVATILILGNIVMYRMGEVEV